MERWLCFVFSDEAFTKPDRHDRVACRCAGGQSLAYVYDTVGDPSVGLTLDEARRIARNIATLPGLIKN